MNIRRFGKLWPVAAVIVLWRALTHFVEDDGPVRAGHMAFTSLLALFPFMIVLGALAGLVGHPDAVEDFIALSGDFLPPGVVKTLTPIVEGVLQQRRGGLLTVGLIGTLWVASSGVEAFRSALNSAYGVVRPWPLWRRRLQGLGFVLFGAAVILTATLAVVAGPILWDWFAPGLGIADHKEWIWDALRYGGACFALIVTVCVLYRLLPNLRLGWGAILPGAVLASLAWLALASLFSEFLEDAADYSLVYGSLSGIIVCLLFFFFSAVVFILGAEVNAALLYPARR